MNNLHNSSSFHRLALAFAFAFLLNHTAQAQTSGTWTGTNGSAWSTSTNWSGSAVPSATGTAGISGTSSPYLTSSATVGALLFTSGASGINISYSGLSTQLTLTSTWAINAQNAANTNTIDVPLVLGSTSAVYQYIQQAKGGTLVIGDGIGDGVISQYASSVTTGLALNALGNIELLDANTFTAQVYIEGATGAVMVNTLGTTSSSAGSLGTASVINIGGVTGTPSTKTGWLQYIGAGETTGKTINLAGGTGVGAIIDSSGSGALVINSMTFTGGGGKILTLQGTSTAANTIGATITNATGGGVINVTKAGVGTWYLTGNNTFTGSVTVSGGILNTATQGIYGSATVSGTNLIALASDGVLQSASGGITTTHNVSLTGGQGAIDLNGASVSITGSFTGPTAGILTIANSNASTADSFTFSNTGNAFVGGLNIYSAGALTTVVAGSGSTSILGSGSVGMTNNTKLDLGGNNISIAGLTTAGTGYYGGYFTVGGNGTNTTVTNASGSTSGNTLTLTGAVSNGGGPGVFGNIFAGVISNGTGTLSLAVTGGTQVLTGANTYTGTTTISSGAMLELGYLTTTGSLSTGSAIVDNGTLAFDRTNTVTQGTDFASSISGSGGITQNGTGVLVLGTSANTNTGTLTINGGTVNASTAGINGSGAATGTNTIVFNGGALQATSGASISTAHGVTLAGAGTFDINGTNSALSGTINGSGALTVNNSNSISGTLVLSGTNTFSGGLLLTNTGGTSNGLTVSDGGTSSGVFGSGVVTMGNNTTLDLADNNVTIGGLATSGNGTGVSVTNLSGTATNTLTLAAQAGTSNNFAGVLSDGTGTLSVAVSNGTQVLSGNNTYTGTTVIKSAGTLQLGNGGATGSLSTSSAIQDAGTFAVNQTGSVVQGTAFASTIVGNGGFTQSGSGTTTLSGTNNYTGATTVTNGTLQIGNGTAGSISSASSLVLGGGTFYVLGTSSGTTSAAVNGVTINAGGPSGIAVNSNGGSGTTLALGAITENTGGMVNFTLPTTGSITTTTANASYTNGTQTILGGWATVGGNTWAVSGSGATPGAITGLSTYSTGLITANGGANIDVAAGYNSVTAGLTFNSLRFNGTGTNTNIVTTGFTDATGGILETSNVGAYTVTFSVAAATGAPDLYITQNNTAANMILAAVETGTMGIVKSGAGTLKLSANNTYTGGTYIDQGTITVGGTTSLSTGPVFIGSSGTLDLGGVTVVDVSTLTGSGTIGNSSASITSTLFFNSNTTSNFSGVIQNTLGAGAATVGVEVSGASAVGTNLANSANVTLGGNNTYTGTTTLGNGLLYVSSDSNLGSGGDINFIAGANNSGALVATNSFTLNSSRNIDDVGHWADFDVLSGATLSYGGIINGAAGALYKLNSGTLVLSGANTYTGVTSVMGGTLELNFAAAGAPQNNIISSSSSLNSNITTYLGGIGTLLVVGSATQSNTQTFASYQAGSMENNIILDNNGTGVLTVNLGAFTSSKDSLTNLVTEGTGESQFLLTTPLAAPAGGAVTDMIFNGDDLVAQTTLNGTATLVPYSTVQSYASATSTSIAGNSNSDMSVPTTTLSGNTSPYNIRFNTAEATTLTISGTYTLNLQAGVILETSNVGNNLVDINGNGIVTHGSSNGVIFAQYNTQNLMEVDAQVGETGNNIYMAKDGPGTLWLNSSRPNSWNASSWLNDGITIVTTPTIAGTVDVNQSLTASGSTVTVADATPLFLNEYVTGTGIPVNTRILAISGNVVTLSNTITTSTTTNLTFSGGGGLGFSNAYQGVIIGNGATLQIGNGGTSGALLLGQSIGTNGNLVFDRSDTTSSPFVFTDLISNMPIANGAGNVTVQTGAVRLNAINSYGGVTTIGNGATLQIGTATTAGASLTITSTATASGSGGALATGLSGTSTMLVTATNPATLGLVVGETITGSGIAAGTVITSINLASTVNSVSGTYTIGISTAATGLVNNATITGSATSSLTLGGTNSSIGNSSNAASNLVLDGGTLQIIDTNATTTDRLFTYTANGGTIDSSGSGNVAVNFTNTGSLAASGTGNRTLTLTGTSTGANSLASVIVDPTVGVTNLTKSGVGTWTLTGANTFTGVTNITGGILKLGNNKALQNSTLNTGFSSGALDVTAATAPTFGGLTGSGSLSSSNITGYSGVTGVTLNTVSGVNDTYTGAIANGSGSTTLTKTGFGSQTLNGTNTYTGATTVNAGSLILGANGVINALSAVTINNGGNFAGTGIAGGAVTVASGGTITPGISGSGILTVGSIVFQTGSDFAVNLSGTTGTELVITGTAAIGTGADITFTVGSTLTAASYTLATAASGLSSSTQFTVVGALPTNYTLSYTGTAVLLVKAASPPADQTFTSPTPTTINIIAGSTTTVAVSATLTNTGTVGANNLNVLLTDGSGSGGTVSNFTSSAGSSIAQGSSSTITGSFTAGNTTGLGQTWKITNTDNSATTTSVTTGGTVNVYSHSTPTLAVTSGNNQSVIMGGSLGSATATLSNTAGSTPAPLDVSSLSNLTGSTGTLVVTSGGTATYSVNTGSASTGTVGLGQTLNISATAGDSSTITGANPLSAVNSSLTYNVYGHADPTVSGSTVNLGYLHAGYTSATGSIVATNSVSGTAGSTIVNLKGSGTSSADASASSIAAVTAGGSATITTTLNTGLSAGTNINETINYTFADDSTLSGASSNVGTVAINVTGSVYSGQSVWSTNGGGAWGTLTGTGTNTFGTNWGAGQGSPGLDPNFTNTDTATFNNSALTTGGTATVVLNGAAPSLNGITFSTTGGGYTIAQGSGTGSLTLAGSGAFLTDSGTGSAKNTISTGVHLANDVAADVVNAGDIVTLSGTIDGSGKITKSGSGELILSGGYNTFTGGLTVTSGTVQLSGSTTISGSVIVSGPLGTGILTLGDGTTLLDSGSTVTIANTVMLSGTINLGGSGGFDFDSTGLATASQIILTGNTTLNVSDNSTIADNITLTSTSTLTKIGTGTLTITGTASGGGGTTITGGTLQVVSGGSLGTGTISMYANTGLDYIGSSAGTIGQAITSTGTVGSTATITNGSTGGGDLTLSGSLNKADTNFVFDAHSGNIDITGSIVSTGAVNPFDSDVYITDTGTVPHSVTYDTAQTYAGATHIYGGGTLVNGVDNAAPTSTIIELGNSDATAAESGQSYTNTYELNGHNQTIAGLTSTNPVGYTDHNSVIGGSSTLSTLTITGSVNSILGEGTFGGSGTNANNLAVVFNQNSGSSTTLTGSNTYTGGTEVKSGELFVNNSTGSATGSGLFKVDSLATVSGTGTINASSITISGTSGAAANVMVGNGTETSGTLHLISSLTSTTTFSNANLTFNLDTSVLTQSTNVDLGDTSTVLFSNSTTLTLNLQGGNIVPNTTQYVLFTSTGSGSGLLGSAFTDLTAGTSQFFTNTATETVINGLNLTFNNEPYPGYYANSYLVLINTGSGFNIDVEVVPEPSTWALMLGGLALLVVIQRRRRSKNS